MATGCKAINKAGAPCSATHYRDGWCRWHHPDLEAERVREREAGGRAKSNKARARRYLRDARMGPDELEGLLCRALIQVSSGQMSPGVLTALAAGVRAYVAVREHGELDARLEAVETSLALPVTESAIRRVR